jgi:uncharacterized MAPEG superfamily protein
MVKVFSRQVNIIRLFVVEAVSLAALMLVFCRSAAARRARAEWSSNVRTTKDNTQDTNVRAS